HESSTRAVNIVHTLLHFYMWCGAPESWGAALHYFTGYKANNIRVRRLGIDRGLKINEYGVFRERRGKGKARAQKKAADGGDASWVRVGGRTEAEVFDAVGMDYVPPELREDRGEVEAALEGTLPTLITLDDIRG